MLLRHEAPFCSVQIQEVTRCYCFSSQKENWFISSISFSPEYVFILNIFTEPPSVVHPMYQRVTCPLEKHPRARVHRLHWWDWARGERSLVVPCLWWAVS